MTVPQMNAMPPMPGLDMIVHHGLDENDRPIATHIEIRPEPAVEISPGFLIGDRFMLDVTSDGHLVVRAENGTHIFRAVGFNRDHQRRIHVRMEWLDTLEADPPPIPDAWARRHRARWDIVEGEQVRITYPDEPPELTQAAIAAAHTLLHDIAPAEQAQQVHDLIDGLVWEINWERDQRRDDWPTEAPTMTDEPKKPVDAILEQLDEAIARDEEDADAPE